MPHGTPDWGLVGPKRTVYGLDDLGEHAVRLNSPALWDRRGDVVVITDFREGLGTFGIDSSGAGASVALFAGNQRQGAYCVALTSGSSADWYARLTKWLPPPILAMIGLEFSFSIGEDTEYIRWELEVTYGGTLYGFGVRYDHVNNVLEYRSGLVVWTQFAAGVTLYETDRSANTGKMVVNPSTGQYARFMINDRAELMTGLIPHTAVPGGADNMFVRIEHNSVNLHNETSYVDNVIVTQNEM